MSLSHPGKKNNIFQRTVPDDLYAGAHHFASVAINVEFPLSHLHFSDVDYMCGDVWLNSFTDAYYIHLYSED